MNDPLNLVNGENTLMYIADPLCSWCYGFSKEIREVLYQLPDLKFQLVMGGLRPFGTERIDTMKDFLKEHWEHVHERSAVPFSYQILDDTSFVYDTEPPCRAVLTVRKLKPAAELSMFHRIQTAFYQENKRTDQLDTYLSILPHLEVDPDEFMETFTADLTKEQTLSDFDFAKSLGIQGFPSTILRSGRQMTLLSRGYIAAELLVERIASSGNAIRK